MVEISSNFNNKKQKNFYRIKGILRRNITRGIINGNFFDKCLTMAEKRSVSLTLYPWKKEKGERRTRG